MRNKPGVSEGEGAKESEVMRTDRNNEEVRSDDTSIESKNSIHK